MKYKLKDSISPKIGDESESDIAKYKVSDVDKRTGSVEWKVKYKTDFNRALRSIESCIKDLEDVRVNLDTGSDFNNALKLARGLKNEFRKVMRNNYPKEYKNLSETSVSGGVGAVEGINKFKLKKKLKENKIHQDRIESFNPLIDDLNKIILTLKQKKRITDQFYKKNPNSNNIIVATDTIKSYINDIKILLK